jgi:hypothetical protein
MTHNRNNTNIQKYLLGDNPKLFGSIIGFKRGWRKNNPDFLVRSIFLFTNDSLFSYFHIYFSASQLYTIF